MSGGEVKQIKDELKALRDDVKDNTKLTREAFDGFSKRLSDLELAEAKRQGREMVPSGGNINVGKLVLAALAVASAAISLAIFVAQKVLV